MAFFALRLAGPAALTAGGLVWLAAVLAAGGSPAGLAAFAVLFFVGVLCAGRLLTGFAVPGMGETARLAVSFCVGEALLLAGWWALGRWGAWAALAPALVLGAAGAAGWLREKPRLRPRLPGGPVSLLLLFMGMFLFFHAFWGLLPAATPERLGVWTYNQDLLWSVGNAASGAFGAPFGDMRMAGYALNYHYLNDLSAGLLARAAGASAWAGLAFYWYAPVGLLTLAALWALEGEKPSRAFWPCFFLACAALCMIKSTLGALAACALVAAAAVSLVTGRFKASMAGLAGLCAAAFALYTHYSFSQVYFLLAAIPMWWLAAMPALECYGRWLAARRASLRPLGAAALGAACLCAFGWQLADVVPECREGVQAALRCAGLRMSQPTEESILAGDWQAARWLEENSDPADIFATNRNNKTFAGSDGVFHFYTAASERRSYLESYRYALDYDNAYAETRRRLEQVSDAIFYRLSEEEAFRLAREEGVDWLLVSTQVEGWPQWQRTPDFANDAVRLYKVPA